MTWYHAVCMIYLIIILIFFFLISCWMSTFTLLGLNVWKVQRFSLSCVERLRLMSLFAHERKRKMKVSLLLFLFSLTAATFGFKITEEHLKEKRFFFEVRNNTISSRQIFCLSKGFLNWIYLVNSSLFMNFPYKWTLLDTRILIHLLSSNLGSISLAVSTQAFLLINPTNRSQEHPTRI